MSGLFSKLKNVFSKEPQTYSFTQTKSFKGFKKFPMEVNLDPVAKANNLKFKDADLAGMSIVFKDVAPDRIDVFLNDMYIGYIWEKDRISDLRNNKISDFHVKFQEDRVFDATTEEIRFRAHLLTKYV